MKKKSKYNKKCEYLTVSDNEVSCDIKMDLTFCNKNCAFATDNKLRTPVYKTRINGKKAK